MGPGSGFTFGGRQDENGQVIRGAGEIYAFRAEGDHTLTALFDADPEYRATLQTDPQDGGTITATAKPGYDFMGWYKGDDLESADASYQSTVGQESALGTSVTELKLSGNRGVTRLTGLEAIRSWRPWPVSGSPKFKRFRERGGTAGVCRVESTAGTGQGETRLTHKAGTSEMMFPPLNKV